jgi:MoaD family protein
LFAALRELAGASTVEATGATVQDIVTELSRRYGERFERIVAAGTVVVNGETADRDRPLTPNDQIALLPPVSGGSRGQERAT